MIIRAVPLRKTSPIRNIIDLYFLLTIFIYGTFSYYQIYFFIILKVIVNIGVAIALNGKPLTAIEDIFSHLKEG